MLTQAEPQVERPARLKVQIERARDRLTISYWRRRWQQGLLFALALVFWTVGVMLFGRHVLNDPRMMNIMVAAALASSWILLAFATVTMFLQHDKVTLDRNGAIFSRSALFPMGTQAVPLPEIIGFEVAIPQLGGWCPESGAGARGIAIQTVSQPRMFGYASSEQSTPGSMPADLQFVFGLPEQERTWLTAAL